MHTVPASTPLNRLAREASPYLRQHMANPVDWFPWGEEAFAKARAEDKPIFLSIGYSTCHWCHVMERESFESAEVAAFLRGHFVSIKVDREERPDVDRIYMAFVQATTGSGGWPLNVWLTPELKPFFGGTYYAPDARYGRPSFLDMLAHIAEAWRVRRAEIETDAGETATQLAAWVAREPTPGLALTERVLTDAARALKGEFDPRNGGFGRAPKFPQPSFPALLLRAARRFHDAEAATMVRLTCEKMAAGGIYDHLDGGFARYSVDERWLVPHFEKMLYDNAQLAELYLDTFLVTGEERFAAVARGIVDYVLRDMTHGEGGFFSAEDADSEGHEGKFQCWTRAELGRLLTVEEFNVATQRFGITEEGNFHDHSHPQPLAGQNVLSLAGAEPPSEDVALMESAVSKMRAARSARVRPHRDDKVLASWNGLMLGAVARAAVVLGRADYLAAAERNAAFVRAQLWQADTLFHRWRDGERDMVQLLEAYAFQLAGTVSLYEATLAPAHLDFAVALAEAVLRRFFDEKDGGFWQAEVSADLILRVKEDYDGAIPSGNSVTTLALLKLAAITGRADFRDAADRTLRLFADRLQRAPHTMAGMCAALDFSLGEPCRVVIAGDAASPEGRALLRAAHAAYLPNKVVLGTAGAVEPFARTLAGAGAAGTVAHLCAGTACQLPTSEPEQLARLLCEQRG